MTDIDQIVSELKFMAKVVEHFGPFQTYKVGDVRTNAGMSEFRRMHICQPKISDYIVACSPEKIIALVEGYEKLRLDNKELNNLIEHMGDKLKSAVVE